VNKLPILTEEKNAVPYPIPNYGKITPKEDNREKELREENKEGENMSLVIPKCQPAKPVPQITQTLLAMVDMSSSRKCIVHRKGKLLTQINERGCW